MEENQLMIYATLPLPLWYLNKFFIILTRQMQLPPPTPLQTTTHTHTHKKRMKKKTPYIQWENMTWLPHTKKEKKHSTLQWENMTWYITTKYQPIHFFSLMCLLSLLGWKRHKAWYNIKKKREGQRSQSSATYKVFPRNITGNEPSK